jgi:hypothetical protein
VGAHKLSRCPSSANPQSSTKYPPTAFIMLKLSVKTPWSLRRICCQTDRPNRARRSSNEPGFLSKYLWNPKPMTMYPRSSMRTFLKPSSEFPSHRRQRAEMVRPKRPPCRRCCPTCSRRHLPGRLRKTNHMPPTTMTMAMIIKLGPGNVGPTILHTICQSTVLSFHGLLLAVGDLTCRISRDKNPKRDAHGSVIW